ncbi:MAG: hypothetical protein ACXWIH_08440 [Burkholderiales bacterium]
MYLRPLAIGASTFIPGMRRLLTKKGTGSTSSATYCYEVWLKHLVLLWAHGMRAIPKTMAELGPGDSLGVGLAAMLCGVDHYFALDVVDYSNPRSNLAVFDALIELLRNRTPRASKGWPDYDQYLDNTLFPGHILTDRVLEQALEPSRIKRIRAVLQEPARTSDAITIKYRAPWLDDDVIDKGSVDVILSHAVLQSVLDLDRTYAALYAWLKPGGSMSHQIDFTSFRTSRHWNGHWAYSDAVWKLIVGKRPYLINREPHSTHIDLLKKHGFELVCDLQNYSGERGIPRAQLSPRWNHIGEDDFACAGAFIQARKPEIQARAAQAAN